MSPFRQPSSKDPEETFVAPDFRVSSPTTVGQRAIRGFATLVYGAWSVWVLRHVIETEALGVLGGILLAVVVMVGAVFALGKLVQRLTAWKARCDAEYVAWLMLRDRR